MRSANQWTGFYVIKAPVMKELNINSNLTIIDVHFVLYRKYHYLVFKTVYVLNACVTMHSTLSLALFQVQFEYAMARSLSVRDLIA